MQTAIRAALPFLMALALTACGGGSGSSGVSNSSGSSGGSGGTTSSEGSWLSFNPNPVEVSGFEGESIPFKITATSSRTFSKPFNVAIVDTSGTINTDVQVSALNEMTYVASLSTSAKLPAGTAQAKLEVRLCEDAPLTCAKPLPGSPWQVPLKVNVKSAAEAGQRLALSVKSLDVVTYPGEKATLTFSGQYVGDLQGKYFKVGIFDKANLSTTSVLANPQGFSATLETSSNLQPGEYTSNLEVRLCRDDDPRTCSMPVTGSPWTVPLKVTVKSPTNLKVLAAVPGLGAWSSYQGNAAHNGYVDATFNVADFSRRFSIPAPSIYSIEYNSAAIDNGKVFVIPAVGAIEQTELLAINEADGTVAWRANLGSVSRANPAAASNGQVYVTTLGQNAYFWVFDQQTGALLSKTPMSSQGVAYGAPAVFGSDIYTSDGYLQSVSKFSSTTLSKVWSGDMPQYAGVSPTVDADNAYYYKDGKLRALNASDGKLNWEAADPDYAWNGGIAPTILSGKYSIVQYNYRLMAFDTSLRKRVWSVSNGSTWQPAVGNGLVYAIATGGLEARTIADGQLQWRAQILGSEMYSNLIVTRNLAFISSNAKTIAIDLGTREVVWTYPRGGNLSISSNGVLYILSGNSNLTAINLK